MIARIGITRMGRRTTATLALGAMLLGGATGCVSQEEYDNLAEANLSNSARLAELRDENRNLQSQIEQRQGRISALEGQIGGLEQTRSAMESQIAEARKQYEDFESRLNSISLSGLDPKTDRRLRDLAASDPDLMKYDANAGVIRFTSDLTFASGSDVVRDSAKGAISTLARVLLESEASGYDLMVVGHTDSQRISRSKDRHPTNRHLSAHRSISVSNQLSAAGLPSSRILVSGWGPYDPIAPNNSSGGTAANRRVEIFLMPSDSFRTGKESFDGADGNANMSNAASGSGSSNAGSNSSPPPIVK